jgi:formiminoglutamase
MAPTNLRDYHVLSDLIVPWDFVEEIDAGIAGVPFDKGNRFLKGTSLAPNAIREVFPTLASRSFDFETDIATLTVRDLGDVQMHPTDAARCHANIEEALTDLYRLPQQFIPIVIGGDHSIAAPTIRAFKRGRAVGKLGLIHFDAHNDLRDPTDEGASSGTPFRLLIDEGVVDGRHAVQVGLHGFLSSSALRRYADGIGLRMISAREVRRCGIEKVVEAAVAQAGAGTDGIYVSFDIDVIEAAMAPGTGAHAPAGLLVADAFEAMRLLGRSPQVAAMDLVEIDPLKDVNGMTPRVGCTLILSFLVGLHERLRR